MRRIFNYIAFAAITFGSFAIASQTRAQENGNGISEPVFRISKNDSASGVEAAHPLDPALRMAHESLAYIRENVRDYTATLIKRERIDGKLGDYEYMYCKVRNRKFADNETQTAFGVYLAFLKPSSMRGREVIFVENQNDGNMVAHEGGFKGRFLPTVKISPTGAIAMSGQRYPMTDIGIENLVVKLIERGERDKAAGPCEVQFRTGAKVGNRTCTVLQLTHQIQQPHYDFHIAQVFLDDELKMPIRYAAYDWPSEEGGKPEVIEEYTYQDVKVNVGLTDSDFDPNNKDYNFYRK